jgi:hypothetical protein
MTGVGAESVRVLDSADAAVDRNPVRDRLGLLHPRALDLAAANVSTSLGAVCFLIGALLLVREVEPEADPG